MGSREFIRSLLFSMASLKVSDHALPVVIVKDGGKKPLYLVFSEALESLGAPK